MTCKFVTTHLIVDPARTDVWHSYDAHLAAMALRDGQEVVVKDTRTAFAVLKAGGVSDKMAHRRIKFATTGEWDGPEIESVTAP